MPNPETMMQLVHAAKLLACALGGILCATILYFVFSSINLTKGN